MADSCDVQGDSWTLHGWIKADEAFASVIAVALEPPAGVSAFEYATGSLADNVEERLRTSDVLHDIAAVICTNVEKLRAQAAQTGEALNAKFASDGSGSIELAYGGSEAFYAGLESSIGPPLMRNEPAALLAVSSAFRGYAATGPTILGQMGHEHLSIDSDIPFPSQVCARAAPSPRPVASPPIL
jgi:hypothetical protein